MIPFNFEARRFGEGRSHAEALAAWCGGSVFAADEGKLLVVPPDQGFQPMATPGDWIVRQPDGTFRVDGPGGGQDGYCADCGEPVWWHDGELVNSPGVRWCFGPDRTRVSMERHHALPGMHQWIARARDGEVCRCLARGFPHTHMIVPVPVPPEKQCPDTCGQCDHGLVPVGHCNCDPGPEGQHQPLCGFIPCPAGCWEKLHPPVPDQAQPDGPGYYGQGELADFDPGTGRSSQDDWGT